jgi:hypothetical protein
MKRYATLALLGLLTCTWTATAEHANITLRVCLASDYDAASGQMRDEVTAASDQEPPLGGHNARPLFKVKAGEPLFLQFFYTNTYPHGLTKDAQVRYFVAREEKVRQKTLPDLSKGTVTQGAFHLNFKPKGMVGAQVNFTIREPGIYLLRVEGANTNSDHEHFSAIDIQVE